MKRVLSTAVILVIGATLASCGGSSGPDPADAFRSYIDALNKHDGAKVCQLLVPEATAKLHPPEQLETCAESVTASFGHRRPNGSKWKSTKVDGTPSAKRSGDTATLDVTVEDTYADGKTQSARETVKMRLIDGAWLLAEPDATLYRAIGQK